MRRPQALLSLLAGTTLLLSCVVHLFVGWPQLEASLISPQLSGEVVSGIRTVWIFAGVAMGLFGIIALKSGRALWLGKPIDHTAIFCIGLGYTIFGGWTLVASGFDPFFLIFLLPGVALLAASPTNAPGTRP